MTMPWPRRAFRLPWRARPEIEADLDEELQFHLERRTAELIAKGMHPSEAGAEARRRFGNLDETRRYCRAQALGRARRERRHDRSAGWGQDLRFALRQMVRAPGFTAVAVLTIGLGVGANTAIFSAVHRLLLDPLPFPGGDRIVALYEASERNGVQVSPQQAVIAAWHASARTLERVEIYSEKQVTLRLGEDEPQRVRAGLMTSSLPRFLGVTFPMGRGFSDDETIPNGPRVVVIGHGLWQRRFGGRRDVLGQTLDIEGEAHTIVGVAPRDFSLAFFASGTDQQLWLPLPPPAGDDRIQALARLRPGYTPEQATEELGRIERDFWESRKDGAGLKEIAEFTGRAFRPQEFLANTLHYGLLVLFGVVGLVLLIACANVANLLLARAATRSHEFAVRSALGAGRARLIRQLLTESATLALLGGGLGVVIAWKGLDLLALGRPASLSRLDDVRLEPIALAWSLGLTLVTGLLFGLAPAVLATDRHLADPLRSAGTARSGSRRFRSALVILEVGMSVTLLVGAGLLVRTLRQMQQVELGFNPEGIEVVTLALPEPSGAGPSGRASSSLDPLLAGLLTRVKAIPGVIGAAYAAGVPPKTGIALGELQVEGRDLSGSKAPRLLGLNAVNPEFFAVLQLPLRAGRFQRGNGLQSVIINENMARRFWPGEDPIGKRYRIGTAMSWMTVTGVAGDIRVPGGRGALDSLQTYLPLEGANEMYGEVNLVVRNTGATGIARQIRAEVEATGGGIRITSFDPLPALLDEVLAEPRFTMALFSGFAALALILATIGLYGVVSYTVNQRTREIGVRIALGAGRLSVIRLVLWQGLGLTLLGVVLGLVGAAAGTRAMRSLLFGVSPLDPVTFAVVAGGLMGVALLAAYLPARRALRVDPVVALRGE